MCFRNVVLVLIVFCFSSSALAENTSADKPPHESWTFSFGYENDLFADTDRFYTNGIQLNWISPELKWFEDLEWFKQDTFLSRQARNFIDILPFSSDPERQRHLSFSLGQKMFTPQDIVSSGLVVNERPYAGWLYGDIAFHSKNQRRLDTFEIQLGIIGDISLAEEAQDLVHSIRGIDKANGWGNQLENEVGIAFIYDRKQRLIRRTDMVGLLGFDTVMHGGVALGNVFTHLNTGAEFRFGWNIPTDFGSALIRPAGNTNAPTDSTDPRYQHGKNALSFYLFAAANGRWVLRDIFLDGNTFEDSHSIDKKSLVGEFVLGSSVVIKNFKISYAQVFRSKEFDGQPSGQSFGSISLSYTY
ncbi:MAG: lipid A 3-O-deacylase [Gammaproteobacteria bacterium]|jgi:lipid A 3-O-deacylase